MRYFEDLEVGKVERFGSCEVTREEVVEFAAKYDPQPFHLDDAAAAQTHFGRVAASGWHTCAMAMRMMVDHWMAVGYAGLGSPGIDGIRFLRPVFPGDILTCELEVLEKRPSRSKPDIGISKSEWRVFNQDGVLVLSLIGNDLVRRRPA